MLHIGVLGHSIPGSAHCYQEIARYGEERLGDYQHPDVTLDCIAMGRSMPLWNSGDQQAVRAILAGSVERLAAAGCDFFVCPDNTAHLALDLPGPELALPMLHIAEVVAAEAAARGFRKVGIMGTAWTMSADMYPRALAAHGIDSAAPTEADQRDVRASPSTSSCTACSARRHETGSSRWPARWATPAATRWRWCAQSTRSCSPPTCRRCRPSTRPACWPGRPSSRPCASDPN